MNNRPTLYMLTFAVGGMIQVDGFFSLTARTAFVESLAGIGTVLEQWEV